MPIPPLTSISTHAPSAVAPGNGLLEQMFMLPGLRTLAAGSGEAAATMQAIALDLFVIFGSAAIAAILLKRLRIAVIPGYFLAGMLVGPGGMGLVMEGETLEMISFFAVILLLFGIGMHLDLDLLKREMGPMLIAGVGSCALTASVGFGVCVLLGISAPAALAIGMAFSLSSTAVVMRIIAQRRDLRRPHGRLALAILIIQDLAVIVMLALLPLLATWGTTRAVEDAAAATVPGQVEVTTEERAAADARSAGNVETGAAATSPANSLADATAAPTEATRQATAGGAVPHLPGVPVPSHTTGDAAAAAIGSGESGASDAIVRPRIGRLAGAVDGEEEDTVPEAARRMAIKIAGAAVILALGLIVLPRVVEEAASGGAPEVLTIVGLAVAIGAAAATKWLGFSAELGAFVG
ncbi:MAG: cation:proton antiporter, partial [Planctomycetota bacterium]